MQGGDLQFDFVTPGASDVINVTNAGGGTGAANFTAASTISPSGGAAGSYTIVTASSPITYGVMPTVTPIANPLIRPTTYALDTASDANALKLNVTGGAKTLNWTGATNGDWDINATTNWNDGAVAEKFFNGDLVTFPSAAANRNITLAAAVQPGSMSVETLAGSDYSITGAGSIGGSTGLTKQGAGTLILATSNSYSGPTLINAGTLILSGNNSTSGLTTINSGAALQVGAGGPTGSLGTGDVNNEGVLAFNHGGALTVNSIISGAGAVTKSGTGTVTLDAVNTYSGPTTITGGTLNITSASSLGPIPGGAVNISGGGALDLAGIPGANSVNFSTIDGAKQFNISGAGVNGTGAIINSGTVAQQNAFQLITLTGNATVGGSGRFDMRDPADPDNAPPTLNLAGFTLTKTGTGQFTLVGTTVSGGNIVVNDGVFAIETTSTVLSSDPGTITYNPGSTAQFFNLTGEVSRPMIFNGNTVGNASGQDSTVASNITLAGDVTFTNLNNSTGALTLTGNITETGGPRSVTKNGPTVLNLNGTTTYSGTTTINGGTVNIPTGATLTANNSVSTAAGTTLNINGTAVARRHQRLRQHQRRRWHGGCHFDCRTCPAGRVKHRGRKHSHHTLQRHDGRNLQLWWAYDRRRCGRLDLETRCHQQ